MKFEEFSTEAENTPINSTEQPVDTKRRFLTEEEQKDRIEKIKEKIIDLKKYRGFTHFTQLGNLEGILTQGLTVGKYHWIKEKKKRRWGYEGELGSYGGGDSSAISLSYLGVDNPFSPGGKVSMFSEAGPVGLIFDTSEIPDYLASSTFPGDFNHLNNDLYRRENKDWEEYERRKKIISGLGYDIPGPGYTGGGYGNWRTLKLKEWARIADAVGGNLGDIEIRQGKVQPEISIPKTSIEGLVLNYISSSLKRRKAKGKKDAEYMRVTAEQSLAIAQNRLSRSLRDPESNVVPLYDREGDVLWPEYIPYEKVKGLVEKKPENK